MPLDRDVHAFDERAPRYERGWLGRLHHDIADRTADLAMARAPEARRILDVGCGSGYLVRRLAQRLPDGVDLVGIDPAPGMVRAARAGVADDRRVRFDSGFAEDLPYPDGSFDLIVSTTSFDHWADQGAGLAECARVLAPGGHLVLTDLISPWLLPTLVAGHRGRARTVRRASRLLSTAGFGSLRWHRLYRLILRTVTATR
ncbi:MAG: class I SAM-dependent methyltransferase [Candidatus Dormibacteria bacterium]|jgi:ubiquinone/menaquinone biosynthesis C-methylase UbiE